METRTSGGAAVGAEARYAASPDEARAQGGLTAKLWLEDLGVLLQAEAQAMRQTFVAGGARTQLVGALTASWQPVHHPSWLVDVALEHYDEDVAIHGLDRDAVDTNLHWFAWSHAELLLTTRLQAIGLGSGGDTSGFALLQLHYRL